MATEPPPPPPIAPSGLKSPCSTRRWACTLSMIPSSTLPLLLSTAPCAHWLPSSASEVGVFIGSIRRGRSCGQNSRSVRSTSPFLYGHSVTLWQHCLPFPFPSFPCTSSSLHDQETVWLVSFTVWEGHGCTEDACRSSQYFPPVISPVFQRTLVVLQLRVLLVV